MENKEQDQSKQKRKRKIGTQLTITIVLLCASICVALTIVAGKLSHKAISNEMLQTLSREVECISNEVYQLTVARQKQVAVMANVDQIRKLQEINLDDEATTDVVTMLKNSLAGDGDINRFVLINPAGEGMTTEYNPVNLVERLYFKQYKEGQSPQPDCIISKTSGKQTVMYSAPIHNVDGINIGLLCTGVDAHAFSDIVRNINVGTEHPIIIKYDGQFIASKDAELVMSGANLFEVSTCGETLKTMLGDTTVTAIVNEGEIEKIYSFTPVKNTPWYVGISLRTDEALSGYTRLSRLLFLICFILIVVSIVIAQHLGKMISNPIKIIIDRLKEMSLGVLQKVELKKNNFSEIDEIYNTTNNVIDGLAKAADFADNIGKGNLDAEFDRLSEDDNLGTNLLLMRKRLQDAEKENAKRKIEDEKVNWATLGLAKFGEILHTDNQNINDLSYEILRNLIKYIDVNQGAIYVVDESGEEPVYVMTSAIAYDRRKFMQKRFAVGEDLVGRCAYEHKTIYMTDIPENYITITSGMGSATASALLLVPLVIEDKVFGIIELASFNKLEDYKINFVEKLAESIASTISTVKVNERTNELLKQSKVQAEELASQEEEMRQNMEELQATQEEAARRDNETSSIMNVINQKLIVIEYDTDGNITNANAAYSELVNMPIDSIIGQKADEGMEMNAEQRISYNQLWNNLQKGISGSVTSHITLNGSNLWLNETYTPIIEPLETKPYKIVKIGVNITERMMAHQTIDNLQTESAAKDVKIAELESKLETAQTEVVKPNDEPKKAEKQKVVGKTDESEFNAEVGEQPLIEWNDECEIGNEEFDNQRKQLTSLVNAMYTAFKNAKSKKEMKDSLRSLIDFASYHFGTVENYIDEIGYNDKDSFKLAFDNFIAKLELFQKLYNAGKIKSADALMLFVSNWLKSYTDQLKELK